jgi:tetratricopeptide (TPR) repeat protein
LSPTSLACLAMAFVNLDRKEFASEILDVLASKLEKQEAKGRTNLHCPGVRDNSWYIEETETTALAALAFMKARPGAEQAKPLIDYLLGRRGAYGFTAAKARGPALEALAHYYGEGKAARDDFELSILVNGKELKKTKVTGATRSQAFAVPAGMLADGDNVVDFRMNGRGEYVYAVTLRGFSKNLADPKSWDYPYVRYKRYYHMPLQYRGKSIGVGSSTQVQNLEIGQRVKVNVDLYHYSSDRDYRGYMVIEEYLPAGTILAEGSLGGNHRYHEVDGNKITLYYPMGETPNDFSYEIIAYATGEYRVLPITLRDAVNPGRIRVGPSGSINVLAPGEESKDPYNLNEGEHYQLGLLNFNDGNYAAALQYLAELRKKNAKYNEKDVCRMLLWIYTSTGQYDARKIIGVFEVLRERYPELEIPFDKILTVGHAYRDLGEWERAYLVFKATIDASFINEANISAVLEDEGLFLGSIDYQEDLWREYPDSAQVTNMFFSISQALYLKAPKAHELGNERDIAILRGGKPVRQGKRKPEKVAMLRETIRLLTSFLTLHPESPLADDAAFSMANALLDLKLHDLVIELCKRYKERFPDSEFSGGYQYMAALGHFWKNNYKEALEAAGLVANSDSKDKDFATYIIGQIHHAEGNPGKAIEWYSKVKGKYADAKQAIDYFEQRHIQLDEINTFRPGEEVSVNLKYRNIQDAFLQVYKVDLMKLYLREKNLSKITSVSLAGIAPLIEAEVPLGDGKDYVDKEKAAKLDLKDPGAYLVICRGDDLYASSLVLVTPLKIEIQEDATSGRVRANVRDISTDKYVAGVHVKAIGSNDKTFQSGETDLRGIYIADNLNGTSTLIARDKENQYAFYRGKTHLGIQPQSNASPAQQASQQEQAQPQYRGNLDVLNDRIQKSNWGGYDSFRRATNKGVQIMQVK